MLKIDVLSQYLFDRKMEELGLDDTNVEETNMAFISIIGTDECIKYWIEEDDKHFFKDHSNVLNLEFDDINGEDILYNGHLFKTMTIEQAEKTVDFIENMIKNGVDTIYVHCKAGFSRSRAVAEFIYEYCKSNNIHMQYREQEDFEMMLNSGVLRRLNHAYWKKHKLNQYEFEGQEYPHDLIEPPIREINR